MALGKQGENKNLLVPDVQTTFLVMHDKLYTVLLNVYKFVIIYYV